MKTFLISLCLLFFSASLYSQDLTGEWHGYYEYDFLQYQYSNVPQRKIPIALSITRDKDSLYKIFSFTRLNDAQGKETTVTCIIACKKTGKHSYVMQEKELPGDTLYIGVPQTMHLKLIDKNDVMKLEGRWESAGNRYNETGDIYFTKLRK